MFAECDAVAISRVTGGRMPHSLIRQFAREELDFRQHRAMGIFYGELVPVMSEIRDQMVRIIKEQADAS